MTPHTLRERQRLQSDADRQVHEAIAEARQKRLNQQQQRRRWWRGVLLVVAVVVALAFTIGLVIMGGAQVTLQRGQ
jgi:anti-sigma-K factor RskA